MKNRRNIVIAFLLCACLIVGVGYAALTQQLEVRGLANISLDAAQEEFDQDVYFKDPIQTSDNLIGTVDASDNDIVNLVLTDGMGVVSDYTTIDLVIANDGNAPVVVAVNPMTSGTDYFRIVADASTYTIPAGGEVTVHLTMTLKVTIDSAEKALTDYGFGITFTATSA